MKRILLAALAMILFTNVSAQTYRNTTLMKSTSMAFSAFRPVQADRAEYEPYFVFSYMQEMAEDIYSNVIFFRGDARRTHEFIRFLEETVEEYKSDNDIMRVFGDLKLFRFNKVVKGIYFFAPGGQVGALRDREINSLRKDFTLYCDKNNIDFR